MRERLCVVHTSPAREYARGVTDFVPAWQPVADGESLPADAQEGVKFSLHDAIMMLKDHRLRKRLDYLRIQKRGERCYTASFIFVSLPQQEDKARYGLTVSRKAGGAVLRNRIKRRLRALMQEQLDSFCQMQRDVVLIARRESAIRSFDLLRKDFMRCLNKLKK